jgi:hypothetical protein
MFTKNIGVESTLINNSKLTHLSAVRFTQRRFHTTVTYYNRNKVINVSAKSFTNFISNKLLILNILRISYIVSIDN